eukprot:jgi/Mesen1/9287/ME000060S08727
MAGAVLLSRAALASIASSSQALGLVRGENALRGVKYGRGTALFSGFRKCHLGSVIQVPCLSSAPQGLQRGLKVSARAGGEDFSPPVATLGLTEATPPHIPEVGQAATFPILFLRSVIFPSPTRERVSEVGCELQVCP